MLFRTMRTFVPALLLALSVPFARAEEGGKVIGKLGQAIEAAPIRSAATSRAKVYYTAKKFQYLVINATKNPEWVSVLLQNGRSGYIEADKVARLPYDVKVKAPEVKAGTSARDSRAALNTSRGTGAKAQMLEYSFQFIGTPYVWGGNSLKNGIDCSGFVQQLFGKIGVDLPRTASEQALVGIPVTRLEELQPGDRLYFWESKRGKIGHTGIFLGFREGYAFFIHSSSGRHGVQTDDLANPKWRKLLVAARRDG